jgi:hypothetical protein
VSAAKAQIGSIGPTPNSGRGGIKVPAIIVWSSGIRKLISTTQVPTGGGKGGGQRTQTVDNITYDIDLGLIFTAHGPHRLIREYANADILIDQFDQSANPSGVYDPAVGPDPDYDPTVPPDPTTNYLAPVDRVNADLSFDGDNVASGTIQGGGSGFAIYPGNNTQQPDPTIEADIDGRYGAGSTPAYRNRSLVVHSALSLSRWGGVVPNITAVWEHQTLKTLNLIFASLCERVGVLAANSDYDFSGIPIESRGLLISGRPFQPKEIIDSHDLQLAYNYFVTEADGQIVGYAEGSEPSVTIPDTEIGWLEGDADLPDIAPEVDSAIAAEISLPREVHVKSLDPDNDWEPNTASAIRQITDGSTVELLEIQICQLSDERRETAQRKLYRDYVAGTAHKFTLPWTYLYLYPGYKITITRAEGFTHVMRLSSIDGGIGVLNCEGLALEPETFNQPANGVFPPGYIPPQPIPAMIVMSMLDIPLFRDADQGKLGYYAGGTPRTGVNQTFNGWTLHSQRNSIWSLRASSNLPATIGAVVSATTLSSDPTTFDNVGVITVDLYGASMTLTSVTEADVLAGKNLAVVAGFILGFTTAAQVAGFQNRWELSGLLNGLYSTEDLVAGDLTGQRFVLLDDAVVFVDAPEDELNLLLPYRGVANGQSLDDAATFNFAWTGQIFRARAPSDLTAIHDSNGDWSISAIGHPRDFERPETYVARLRRASTGTLLRDVPIMPGVRTAAIFGNIVHAPGGGSWATDTYAATTNNNVIGEVDPTAVYVTQPFTLGGEINARVTVTPAPAPYLTGIVRLNFGPFDFTDPFGASTGATIETKSNNSTTLSRISVFDWSTAQQTAFDLPTVNGVVFVRIVWSGTELRWQFSGSPINPAAAPNVILKDVPSLSDPVFLRVALQNGGPTGASSTKVENVTLGGADNPRTIYSLAQQQNDNAGSPIATGDLRVEMWQVSPLAPNRKGLTVKGVF